MRVFQTTTERVEATLGGWAYLSPCRNYVIVQLDADERRRRINSDRLDTAIHQAAAAAGEADMDSFMAPVNVVVEAFGEENVSILGGTLEDHGVSHLEIATGTTRLDLADEDLIRQLNVQFGELAEKAFQ